MSRRDPAHERPFGSNTDREPATTPWQSPRSRAPHFFISHGLIDDVSVIHVKGEIDMTTAPQVVDRLRYAIEHRDPRVVLDLVDVTFIDSKLVHAIFTGARRLRETGGELAIAAAHNHVRRVLEIAGVDAVVDTYASVDEALVQLRRRFP